LGPAMMAQMSASWQCLQKNRTACWLQRSEESRVFTNAENIIRTARKMSSDNYKAAYHAPLLLRATS
jgi:predicted phosphoadenosine phosphosulfate sulfurtransferase